MREDRYRMGFHLMPPKGWLNDPNGLCCFRGEYHVFFQYTPQSPLGGQKYWGHYISADLLHWRFAGIALSPDQAFDRSGVYSGSAVVTGGQDGQQKMHIYYTGNVKLDGEYDYIDSGREANVVYTESADGIHFSEKRLLMTNADYPADYTTHVRDPKVFFQDGSYYMALGGRKRGSVVSGMDHADERSRTDVRRESDDRCKADFQREDKGAVLVYRSEDGAEWKLEQEITTPEPFGYMWECPDLFSVGQRKCLSFCPQGLDAEPYRFQNTDQSGYAWMDGGDIAKGFVEWDMGFEFYAPQTFEDESGRRLMYGWVGLPDTPYENPTVEAGWQHCLTVPRELTVRNGQVCQNPAKELCSLLEDGKSWTGDGGLTETEDFSFWLQVEQIETERFCISIGDHLFLKFENKVFTWEFPDGKTEEDDWGRGRRVRRMELEELTDIRVLCDHSILELFVNGGSRVMCGRFYPQEGSFRIRTEGCGERAAAHFWHMKAMEVKDDETVIGNWGSID